MGGRLGDSPTFPSQGPLATPRGPATGSPETAETVKGHTQRGGGKGVTRLSPPAVRAFGNTSKVKTVPGEQSPPLGSRDTVPEVAPGGCCEGTHNRRYRDSLSPFLLFTRNRARGELCHSVTPHRNRTCVRAAPGRQEDGGPHAPRTRWGLRTAVRTPARPAARVCARFLPRRTTMTQNTITTASQSCQVHRPQDLEAETALEIK